jgi:hypothetical protein
MSFQGTSGGLGAGPGEGEALWFNGGLGVLRATADETEGRYWSCWRRKALRLRCTSIETRMSSSWCSRARSASSMVMMWSKRSPGRSCMGPAMSRTRFTSIRRKPACSCSSGLLELKGSSARAASRPGPRSCRRWTNGSSIGKHSWRSPPATIRNSLAHPCLRKTDSRGRRSGTVTRIVRRLCVEES